MVWTTADITFDLDDEVTSDPVVTFLIDTPAGRLTFIATVVPMGTIVGLTGAHIQGSSMNAIGSANLRAVLRAFVERMGLDGIFVQGGPRTTGANPGRTPELLWLIEAARHRLRAGRLA